LVEEVCSHAGSIGGRLAVPVWRIGRAGAEAAVLDHAAAGQEVDVLSERRPEAAVGGIREDRIADDELWGQFVYGTRIFVCDGVHEILHRLSTRDDEQDNGEHNLEAQIQDSGPPGFNTSSAARL